MLPPHIMASPYLPSRDRKASYLRVNRWRALNRERQEALSAVATALANYDLDKQPCKDCGTDRNVVADEISMNPLRVRWRCRVCANARRRRER